ncbi:MFS general substrate transporter [Hyaloscypha variabilis]
MCSSTSEQHNGPVEPSNHIAADDSDGGEKGREANTNIASEDFLRNEQNLNSAITNKKSGEVILVGWYGPYDQENPQNWSSGRKLLVKFQICILNFGIYIGSSIYTPGELSVMEEFGVSDIVATLGLSLFVLGYGLGPMLFSPMSEIPTIGRSRIYFRTLFVFVLLQLPTGYAVNMSMLLIFRFLTGFFGGPVLATGGATIIDIYPPIEVPYWIGIFGACGVLGPVLGPLVGGFAAQAERWRWTIWELAWLCTAVLMSEIDAADVTLKDQLLVLGRAFILTFSEPVIFFVDLYCALLYGVLYVWFELFPIVFGDIYRFKIDQKGLVFLGIFVGGVITLPSYLLWIRKRLVPQFSKPPVKPEIILPPTFFGAFALPICLFWYGWTSRPSIHWIVPLIGSGFFTVSIITLFMPILTYLGISYPRYAASVLAGNALFRASCGVVFPLFALALFRRLGVGPGNSLLGGLSIMFIPISFTLYNYGERIRHRSKNATG